MLPTHRAPSTPGEILREEFLVPNGMTQAQIAEKMGVPIQRINLLVNGRRAVTAETAILLSEALGTTPEFWLNLQMQLDLWAARRARAKSRRSGKIRARK